jgi:phage protein U
MRKTIVLKPGPARRVDVVLELGRVEEKIEKFMTRWVDPTTLLN